jgi:hypothetical protein
MFEARSDYNLAHRDEVDSYLKQQQAAAAQLRQDAEAHYPPKVTRASLLARKRS